MFLSKTFVQKIILCLSNQIKSQIANEIKSAKSYSIEVDTTQDISVVDQLALCGCYVYEDIIKVRLLKLAVAEKTSGEALYDYITNQIRFK